MRRRILAVGACLVLVVALTAVTWWAASQARTPEQLAVENEPPAPSVITAAVESGPLVERIELPGTAERAVSETLSAPQSEGAVITHLPIQAGDSVESGTVVVEINGRPLIALPGQFRAYRDLKPGDEGRDVRQLQEALNGLYGTSITGTYGDETEQDVRNLYQRIGYDPVEQQGEADPPPTGGGGGTDPTDPPVDGGDQSGPPEDGPATPSQRPPDPEAVVPAAEVLFHPDLPLEVGTLQTEVDAEVGELFTAVSGGWSINAALSEADAQRLQEDVEGTASNGLEVRLDRIASETDDDGATTRHAVFEVLTDEPDLAIGDNVTAAVDLRRSSEAALVVPATALWDTGSGQPIVTVVDDAGAETDVPVTVELSYRGMAAVVPEEPDSLRPDQVVVVGRNE